MTTPTINLLPPWEKIPIPQIIGIILSFILTMCIHKHCQNVLLGKKQQIIQVKKTIECIDHEMNEKSNPKTISPFKKNQGQSLLNLLNTLSETVPIGLYLSELSVTPQSYHLMGYAEKIPMMAQWIEKLAKHHWQTSVQSISQSQKIENFPVKFSASIKFSQEIA